MTAPSYQFGDFRLIPAARELWHEGKLVTLPLKSFDCLTYLIEHRERAVGRDELISAVWGRVDVSDDLLAQTLLRARRAVGDTGNKQQVIRTVPRFGYRWVLPVEETHHSPTPTPDPPVVQPPQRLNRPRNWLLLALVLMLGWALFAYWPTPELAPAPPRSAGGDVLVLPARHEHDDGENTWLRQGVADHIKTQLQQYTGLRVLTIEQTLGNHDLESGPASAPHWQELMLAAGVQTLLVPSMRFDHGEWVFLLDVHHDDQIRSIQARSKQALHAASIATDRFIAELGLAPANASLEPLRRIDVAMLAGDLDDARALIEALPDDVRSDPEIIVRAGQIAFRAGQLDSAQTRFETISEQASVSARVQALSGLGGIAIRHEAYSDADQYFSQAIDLLSEQENPSPELAGHAFNGRGATRMAMNRIDEALTDIGRARLEMDKIGDRIGVAMVDVNLGLMEGGRGQFPAALQAFDRAIPVFARFGANDYLAAALLAKTNAHLALLENPQALLAAEQAQRLSADLENPLLTRRVMAAHIAASIANGQLTAAQAQLDSIDHISSGFDLLRARLLFERDDKGAAIQLARAALARAPDQRDNMDFGDAIQFAVMAARSGLAPELLDQALALVAEPDESEKLRVELALAEQLGRAQQLALRGDAAAEQALAEALQAADRQGIPAAFVPAALAYAEQLLKQGETERASTVIGRLTPYAERDFSTARAIAALYAAIGNDSSARQALERARELAGERNPGQP